MVASTRYEKVGPRLGFAVVPEKADAGLGPPPDIKVEVFVICDQKVYSSEGGSVEHLTYNRREMVATANRAEVADKSRHNSMSYIHRL